MKHNIFQFERNFLAYKPKPIDLFLFSLPLSSKVRYPHEMSVLLIFQTSGQLKVQFLFSLCLHTGCAVGCIFHPWRFQAWLHGRVVPVPALLRVMVGTLNCYRIKFFPRKFCKSKKNYSFALFKDKPQQGGKLQGFQQVKLYRVPPDFLLFLGSRLLRIHLIHEGNKQSLPRHPFQSAGWQQPRATWTLLLPSGSLCILMRSWM